MSQLHFKSFVATRSIKTDIWDARPLALELSTEVRQDPESGNRHINKKRQQIGVGFTIAKPFIWVNSGILWNSCRRV